MNKLPYTILATASASEHYHVVATANDRELAIKIAQDMPKAQVWINWGTDQPECIWAKGHLSQ